MDGTSAQDRAAIILAGGEGTRLRGLVRRLMGQEVPKQFCSLLGEETLLDRTRRRASLAVAPCKTLLVVNQAHQPFYSAALSGVSGWNLVVQPDNRGTAPAILLALLRLAAVNPESSVAIFPSDHYVSDEREFIRHVEVAFDAVSVRPELTVLLGIQPSHPEVSYGWIEPAQAIAFGSYSLYRVREFWEKPCHEDAVRLWQRGGLWNSAVIVARISTLLGMLMVTMPDLYSAFLPLRAKSYEKPSDRSVNALYARIPVTGFSEHVLSAAPVNMAALPVTGVQWSDLGDPQRLMQTWDHLGLKPTWSTLA